MKNVDKIAPHHPREVFCSTDYVWKGNGSSVIKGSSSGSIKWRSHRLDCPIMKVGRKYQWKIYASCRALFEHSFVGITLSSHKLSQSQPFGKQNGEWCYSSSRFSIGSKGHETIMGFLPYHGNLTLILDLSSVTANNKTGGTLSGLLDDESSQIVLAENILKDCPENIDWEKDGFYPAASTYGDAKVEFKGFQSVE